MDSTTIKLEPGTSAEECVAVTCTDIKIDHPFIKEECSESIREKKSGASFGVKTTISVQQQSDGKECNNLQSCKCDRKLASKMDFKYDIVTLIKLVEMRPCLWDKSIEEYKDKVLKQMAWNGVFQYLEERYAELTITEKKEVGDKITSKWINVKDAFLKSLKTKPGQEAKNNYIHRKYLQFLLKCYQKEDSLDNYLLHKELGGPTIDLRNTSNTEYISPDFSTYGEISEDNIIRKRKLDFIETQILDELKISKTGNPQTSTFGMSDDEKFFQSFIPNLKDMTENEKIDFQIDILNSIKKIKNNRPPNHPASVSTSFSQVQIQQEPTLQDPEVTPSKQTSSKIIIHDVQVHRPAADDRIPSYPDLQQENLRFHYKNIFDAFPK